MFFIHENLDATPKRDGDGMPHLGEKWAPSSSRILLLLLTPCFSFKAEAALRGRKRTQAESIELLPADRLVEPQVLAPEVLL